MAMGWERNTHELEADSGEFQGLGGIGQIDCGIHGKKKLEVRTHQHSRYQFYEFIGWKSRDSRAIGTRRENESAAVGRARSST
jgi:hypothetical protein